MFRPEAIDSMASPARLSVLAPVTSARLWVLAAGAALLVFTAFVWGMIGRVPITTDGAGIIIHGTRVALARSAGVGLIREVRVRAGGTVKAGDVIAIVSVPVLEVQSEGAAQLVDGLRRLDRELRSREEVSMQQYRESLSAHESRLLAQIESGERLLAAQRQQLELCERLAKDGSVSQSDLLALGADALDSERALTDARSSLARASQDLLDAQTRLTETRGRRAQEVAVAQVEARAAAMRTHHESMVVAPEDGRVVQLLVQTGESVAMGEPIAIIAGGDSEQVRCFAFFPLSRGKHLAAGMRALISPTIAPRERWGLIEASIDHVEPYASTAASMASVTQNPELVEDLEDRYGAMIGAELAIAVDAESASGMRWTTNLGYPHPVPEGTLCEIEVIIEEVRPAALILPWLRGVGGK